MRVVTIVSLGASAVLGLGALFVAKAVLPNSSSESAAVAEVEGVSVVVAAREIKYGDKLDASMLALVKAPPQVAPQGAFSSIEQVLAADQGGAPVALVPVAAREPLLPTKVSGPGSRPSVAAEIAEGMRAYTIKVTDVSGVGGHALPGDRVDVVLMRDLTPEGQQRNYISYVVLQNVRVLGIDLNADLSSTKTTKPNTATLEVSVEDAQKLSVASTLGMLSLALRRTGEAELEEASPLRTADFLTGGAPSRPAAVRASAPRPAATQAPIIIIEGSRSGGSRDRRRPRPTASASAPATVPGQSATNAADA